MTVTATDTSDTTTAAAPLDIIRSLRNPERKLRAVADLIRDAMHTVEVSGLRSRAAVIILYRNSQGTDKPLLPSALWRETLDVSRSLWYKILKEADPDRIGPLQAQIEELQAEIQKLPGDLDSELPRLAKDLTKLRHRLSRHIAQVEAVRALQAEVAADPDLDLHKVAREEAAAVREAESVLAEAKPIRDEVGAALMNRYGMANAEVARITGLSSARAHQLRVAR